MLSFLDIDYRPPVMKGGGGGGVGQRRGEQGSQ